MRYKGGANKEQLTFMPACVDDYVPESHMCRVISAFTGQLDMSELGYKYAEGKEKGNRPYDPRMMLNLYLYGYLNRVRSSRRLEAETHRNVEVMWLMDGLRPDDKTICNFRKDNAEALRRTFRTFVRMLRRLGLYGGEVEATDSTKFRANNSRKNNHNKTTVERELSRLEKQISEYMNALEQGDKEESDKDAPSAEKIQAALTKLRERKIKVEELLTQVEGEGEVSTVDPDARLMHSGGDARKLDVCYNVQTITDSKHSLIVDYYIANSSSDSGNMETMSELAKEALEVEALTILADKGYYDGEDIAECEKNGITCLVAKPGPGGTAKSAEFTHDQFIYDREKKCYVCPCQNELRFMRKQKHSNGNEYLVYSNFPACGRCLRRAECTQTRYRQILRPLYQDTLDQVDQRTRINRELYRKRQEIVEHPFGTIKSVWGFKQFLCRTKPKVTAETALAYSAYNLRRAINIFADKGLSIVASLV